MIMNNGLKATIELNWGFYWADAEEMGWGAVRQPERDEKMERTKQASTDGLQTRGVPRSRNLLLFSSSYYLCLPAPRPSRPPPPPSPHHHVHPHHPETTPAPLQPSHIPCSPPESLSSSRCRRPAHTHPRAARREAHPVHRQQVLRPAQGQPAQERRTGTQVSTGGPCAARPTPRSGPCRTVRQPKSSRTLAGEAPQG